MILLSKRTSDPPDEAVAFRKAADYCAAQDHCISEVKDKLKHWNVDHTHVGKILERLLSEGFIDEQRYAKAFARGKFRNLQWGRIKIRYELHSKGIPEQMIINALEEIEEESYTQCLIELAKKKIKTQGSSEPLKVMRFLASKGFEPELIRKTMKRI
ncbi:MAG: RecX family transcriptional regulator [Bacteroidales bacterium]|nr:RecX family transcriptional regulator [Bacteroidales bacterium]